MRLAITGALGLVGRSIAGLLSGRGHEVRLIDRLDPIDGTDLPFVKADLTQYDEALEALRDVDAVVHLAGINAPIVAPEVVVHNNNVTSSYNVLSAAAELGIARVVQSSSVNAIGLAWSRKPCVRLFPDRSRSSDTE